MKIMIPTWVGGDLVAVEKLEAHQKGLRHKAVSVFVMHGTEVLIQRRAMCKYHTPGLWANTCCTHPKWGEEPEDCAHRRLDEELGITGLKLEPRDRLEYRADVGGGLIEHEVVDIFTAQVPERISVLPNPLEVMDVDWVDLDVLAGLARKDPGKYTPWLRIYLSEHANQIFA
ncbi:isopentenyl-diphosphate delta-isomerase [Roseovarius rhodophyticola]|uniref:Isopentenyl-diphosphate Delta-isomerase n=1 Tax=Roseovarius rhodophyticola TaxID=3080827 RepID=A0ABZ2TE57_9RHOB|nr:isopentenyl-diphosphate delta-isomerase [Roseovarius sp. W115]MDV2931132.1 isopentenyl-diphosphate delta-isomerase [Roseovarius sp. W115]